MTLQTSKSADINTTKIAVLSLVSMVFIGRFSKLTQRPRCPHYTLLGVVTAQPFWLTLACNPYTGSADRLS